MFGAALGYEYALAGFMDDISADETDRVRFDSKVEPGGDMLGLPGCSPLPKCKSFICEEDIRLIASPIIVWLLPVSSGSPELFSCLHG